MTVKYCPRCKELHNDETLCMEMKLELENNKELLKDALDFTNLAAQHQLVSTQSLDTVAQNINKVANKNLSFEGSHQAARDIKLFNQFNVDAYSKSGHFSSAENAKSYFENASENQLKDISRKITGTGQEVDWHIDKEGSLKRIFEKSKLLGEEVTNAPGIDGETQLRFVKSSTKGVSIKNSLSNKGLGTNVNDILKAIDKGTLNPDDIVVGPKGTKSAIEKMLKQNIDKAVNNDNQELLDKLKIAKKSMKVEEIGNFEKSTRDNVRAMDKIRKGQANTGVTAQQLGKSVRNGAIVGAVVSVSISSISNYMQYKNGEITHEDAFVNIGQDTLKGAVTGGMISGAALFFPPGAIGIATGIAVGFYIGKTTENLLNEVYGKGSVEAVLDSAGYVYGTTVNLQDVIKTIEKNHQTIDSNHKRAGQKRKNITETSSRIENILEDF